MGEAWGVGGTTRHDHCRARRAGRPGPFAQSWQKAVRFFGERNSLEERPCLLVGGSASLQGTKIYPLLPFLGHNMSIYHLSDLNGGTPSRSAKSISAKLCEESLTS